MIQKDKRREDLEDFILHVKTAVKHKWSREQMGIRELKERIDLLQGEGEKITKLLYDKKYYRQ